MQVRLKNEDAKGDQNLLMTNTPKLRVTDLKNEDELKHLEKVLPFVMRLILMLFLQVQVMRTCLLRLDVHVRFREY